ncbi:MAG: M14 family zinc carboxypeptidase [Nocardioides sp.]
MTRLRIAAVLAALALGAMAPVHGSEPTAPFGPQLVRVHTDTTAERATLAGLGLDGTEHAGPRHTDLVLHTAGDRDRLEASGLEWRVTIGDLLAREAANNLANAAYAARTTRSPLPSGRTSYRTLDDYDREMRGLAKRRPALVRTFTLARPTLDGRTVRALEIGSDVRRPASGRPTFVMLGLHHAREWPSAEHTLEFAHDLVRGYGRDPRITRLLDRLRVVLVPVVNADGFDLSRTSGGLVDLNLLNPLDPSGTVIPTATQVLTPGMAYLRKNCRLVDGVDTPDGTCAAMLATPAGFGLGVDLNRNYGMWWGGPGGAGPAPSATEFHAGLLDPRYRGAAPFSEPETRNVRDLFLSRSATGMITNHTFGNLVLRPWSGSPDHVSDAGRQVGLARDEQAMAALGARLARHNGYTSQRSYALYDGMGTTEDWAYGATGTFGYTFEIGAT